MRRGHRTDRSAWSAHAAALCGALLLSLGWPSEARAGEVEDLEEAITAYQGRDYQAAARLLAERIGVSILSRDGRTEARKYLGACYVLLDRPVAAREQFNLVLQADPSVRLPPSQFPRRVRELFDAVRQSIAEREAEEAAERVAAAEAAREDRRETLDVMLQLAALAQEAEVEVPNELGLAFVPFGIGQWQNGDDDAMWIFAIGEGVLAIGGFSLLMAFVGVENNHPDSGGIPRSRQDLQFGLYVASWVTGAAFVGMAIVGIIEAVVNFRPTRTVRATREIPPELQRRIDLQLGLGALRVRF